MIRTLVKLSLVYCFLVSASFAAPEKWVLGDEVTITGPGFLDSLLRLTCVERGAGDKCTLLKFTMRENKVSEFGEEATTVTIGPIELMNRIQQMPLQKKSFMLPFLLKKEVRQEMFGDLMSLLRSNWSNKDRSIPGKAVVTVGAGLVSLLLPVVGTIHDVIQLFIPADSKKKKISLHLRKFENGYVTDGGHEFVANGSVSISQDAMMFLYDVLELQWPE